jgi:hypothetical protein
MSLCCTASATRLRLSSRSNDWPPPSQVTWLGIRRTLAPSGSKHGCRCRTGPGSNAHPLDASPEVGDLAHSHNRLQTTQPAGTAAEPGFPVGMELSFALHPHSANATGNHAPETVTGSRVWSVQPWPLNQSASFDGLFVSERSSQNTGDRAVERHSVAGGQRTDSRHRRSARATTTGSASPAPKYSPGVASGPAALWREDQPSGPPKQRLYHGSALPLESARAGATA